MINYCVLVNVLEYSNNNIKIVKSRRMRWEGFAAYMGKMRNEHRGLVGTFEGKKSFGKPVHIQEIILIRASKIQCNSVEQIYHSGFGVGLSGKVANILMKLIVPYLAKHLTV